MKDSCWFSLSLLFVAHWLFGWILADEVAPLWFLSLAIFVVFLVAESLASPWAILRTLFFRWLNSDTRSFFTVMGAAFLGVVLLRWIHLVIHELVLVAATVLARLDLQAYGLPGWKDFWILFGVSVMGLAIGWWLHPDSSLVVLSEQATQNYEQVTTLLQTTWQRLMGRVL